MKNSFPVLFLTLSLTTAAYGTSYGGSALDNDIEQAISTTLFDKIDIDKNNKVSFDEVYEFRIQSERKRNEKHANDFMTKCDKNKDGKVGEDELIKLSLDDREMSHTQLTNNDGDCQAPIEILEIMDADGDGFITKEEVIDMAMHHRRPPRKTKKKMKERQEQRMRKHQQERFERCDTDKDQFLTLREAASMHCHIYTEMFDARDKDGDALISQQEMQEDVKPPEFDNDSDPYDIERNMPPSALLQMKMSNCDKNENGKLELNETGDKGCEIDLPYFNSVDSNADGAIDYSEMKRMNMKQSFDEMDANNDGWLDKKEFKGSRIRYL